MKIPLQYYTKEYTTREYLEMKHYNNLTTDPAFQANNGYVDADGRDTRWDKKDRESFMTNFVLGLAPSAFTFADMKACLENAINAGDREMDVRYFTKWLVQGNMMNVDSFNRNYTLGDGINFDDNHTAKKQCLSGFFDDETALDSGVYKVCGETVNIDTTNNVWSKLPEPMKNHILDVCKINVTFYTDATQENLSELCRSINEGVAFTAPMKRNTYTTRWANIVRGIATSKKNIPFFTAAISWHSAATRVKRDVDNTIAVMIYQTMFPLNKNVANKGALDDCAKNDVNHKLLAKGAKLVREFIQFLKDSEDPMGQGNSLWMAIPTKIVILHHLFDYFIEIRGEGLIIDKKKYTKLFEDFNDIYVKELADTTTKYPAPKGKLATFDTIKNGLQLMNVDTFKKIFKRNKFNLKDYCIKPDKRGYSADDRLIMATRDNFKTPENKDIPPSQLHDSEKFEGGHGIPYSETYKTNIETGAVQTKKDNRDLGNNPIVYTEN